MNEGRGRIEGQPMTSLGGQFVDCPSWRCTESQAQQQIDGQFYPGDKGQEASALISLMSSHVVP